MGIGKLFFAAVDENETFDEGIHNVEDLQVFNVKISQSEAEFARAQLLVTNPREGLLKDTRKKRLFISCEEYPDGPIVLLFSGRITGFPVDLDAEIVALDYIAQPEDWQATQDSFLDSLKVAPYYNTLFAPPEDRDTPEEILAARSALLHWNRATGDVSLSDILQGAELIDVGENFFFDSLDTTIGDPPLQAVKLDIEVQWEQIGVGEVNLSEYIRKGFINTTGPNEQINTLTPESFEQGWNGILIPKGYELIENQIFAVANSFGLSSDVLISSPATVDGSVYRTSEGIDTGGNRTCTVPRVWFRTRLRLLCEYKQKRTERFTVNLNSQTQEYALTAQNEETIFMRLEDPVSAANGAILDPTLPSFFIDVGTGEFTPHGEDAIQHGLLRARARLAKAMRAVETTFEMPLENALNISCDHSIRIYDDRLPGAEVYGKVLGYTLEVDGQTGRQLATVNIGSSIGLGFDSVSPPGSESFESTVYTTLDNDGEMTSALIYGAPSHDIEVPIDVAEMESNGDYLILGMTIENPGQAQNDGFAASSTPDIYLTNNKTRIVVDLRTVNPDAVLSATVDSVVQKITWPKQIDLGSTIYTLSTEDGDAITTEDGDEITI